jgi:DNA-binding PadR family transcriptional regulator
MHGYRLADFLDTHLGIFFDLKKATAYHLLGKMEELGWVSSHEEQEGRRPPRRVYAITPEGEALFQDLLRASLPAHRPAVFPGNVPILFMDALPSHELEDLLEGRRKAIRERMVDLEAHPDHVGHPLFDHKLLILRAEMEWIGGLLKKVTGE